MSHLLKCVDRDDDDAMVPIVNRLDDSSCSLRAVISEFVMAVSRARVRWLRRLEHLETHRGARSAIVMRAWPYCCDGALIRSHAHTSRSSTAAGARAVSIV